MTTDPAPASEIPLSNLSQFDVSFVIPARNEEALIGATIDAIHEAADQAGIAWEVIVVDDDSEDRTAEVATEHRARVVPVKLHNIGAVRNAGAATATGRMLCFLDADTLLPAKTLAAMLREVHGGAVGGGASVEMEGVRGPIQRVLVRWFAWFWQRYCGWAAGCNIFVLRDVFERIGGFNEKYFAAEERYLSEAIQQQGRFVILNESVQTSGRKLRLYSTWKLCRIAFSALIVRRGDLTTPRGLEILYDAPREAKQ